MASETLIPDPMPPSPPSPAERRPVDPHVWKACAASNSRIPAVGDLVYYFPDGHAEQASSPPDLSSIRLTAACALCRVAAVSLLADADTDETFAKIFLDPRPNKRSAPPAPAPDGGAGAVFFAKVLTPSDANNGGGFSVPRYCADSILPPLDLAAERPVQNLTIRDAHGRPWVFRHIYRGTPRRHLLTTGWSKFVNSKKLIAGDSVVFIRNRSNELYLGIRRTYVTPMPGAFVRPDEKAGSSSGTGGGFSRGVRGRVPPATIVEAVKLIELGRQFEVLHYPRAGVADFLVDNAAVDAALSVPWHQGLRIRMVVEAEDSTRTTWLQGIVSEVAGRDAGPWPRSPWRMLQVRWDDPEAQQNVRYVSPWQVELVSTTSYMQAPPYPASKKLRISGSPDLLSDTNGSAFFPPMSGFSGITIGSLPPFLSDHGIQGARQDSYVSSLSTFVPTSTNRMFASDVRSINTSQPLNSSNVSTELSIGSTSRSHGSSPPSQESIHDNAEHLGGVVVNYPRVAELLGGAAVNCPREVTRGTIQLFGKLIEAKQPPVGDFETKDGVGSLKLLIQ